jgi:hypothetical protein
VDDLITLMYYRGWRFEEYYGIVLLFLLFYTNYLAYLEPEASLDEMRHVRVVDSVYFIALDSKRK